MSGKTVAYVGNSPEAVGHVANSDPVIALPRPARGKGRRRGMRVSELAEMVELWRGLTPEGQRIVMAEAVKLAAKSKAKP